jgi:hypothetical protein
MTSKHDDFPAGNVVFFASKNSSPLGSGSRVEILEVTK